MFSLYFRERVNLGASLRVKQAVGQDAISKASETDTALTAVELYKLLDTGTQAPENGVARMNIIFNTETVSVVLFRVKL